MNNIAGKFLETMRKPLTITICTGIILLITLSELAVIEVNRLKEKETNRITHEYVRFENQIQDFFASNINLMSGFSAFVQTFEDFEDQDVNTYLENLTKNNAYYIKDIGIIQDTTIRWIYPKEGNEKALGADLSKVKDQVASIEYVKKNLKNYFDGPRHLVQGGTGFIIRIPILKDHAYWGITSVVLDADKIGSLFARYEEESDIKVAILNNSADDKLIYGDPSIIGGESLVFNSMFIGNQWTIYVAPAKSENAYWSNLVLLAVIGFILSACIVRFVYHYSMEAEKAKAKNDLLKQEAYRDRLTGLYNRHFLEIRLHNEIDHANRYKTAFSVIYFDLDHFKKVNDQHGHGYGDKVLRRTSEIVSKSVRDCDLLSRWGGEEFIILMPSTNLEGASAAAEKIRALIEGIDHPIVGTVTASFGVAEYYPDEFIGSLLKRVDNALYRSKQEGRNRVTSDRLVNDENIQYRIKWRDGLKSGNAIIDFDHKELLRLGNQLVEDSYIISTYEEAVSRYNELLTHITEHFEREENILKDLGYADLEAHKKAHYDLLENAIDFRESIRENKINAQRFFIYLFKELIVDHLTQEDVKYFRIFKWLYVKCCGRAQVELKFDKSLCQTG